MRLPARVDLDDMTEHVDGKDLVRDASARSKPEVRFLRTLCLDESNDATCIERPGTTQATLHPSGREVHAQSVAVFSTLWTVNGLYATFEGFDTSVELADVARLPREAMVLEDCCDPVPWAADGTAQITYAHGRVLWTENDAPWTRPTSSVTERDSACGRAREQQRSFAQRASSSLDHAYAIAAAKTRVRVAFVDG